MKYLILTAFFAVISGCSSFTSPARTHELNTSKSYWMDYDATRRGTIVYAKDSSWKSCAEPAPDAAIGIVAKLEGKINVANQGEGTAKGALAQSIVRLAEKTQMVLFLRESLFRLCEISLNTNINATQTKELYSTVIKAALELVKNDTASLNLEQQRLASANTAQFIYQYLSEKEVKSDVVQGLLKEMK